MSALSRFLAGAFAWFLACGVVAAGAEDSPAFTAQLLLVRYDLPRGDSDGTAPTRQLARRIDGDNEVDWPTITLDGKPVFRERAEETITLPLPAAGAQSWFQVDADNVIQPGNHWFRAAQTQPGRRHIYTADKTARGAAADGDVSGRYELWTFPIRIAGEGSPIVKNIVLKCGGAVVFKKPGPWRSLTLLLPANEAGTPYELTIDGFQHASVRQNVIVGDEDVQVNVTTRAVQ